ncbi:MAG: biopolymer transporter ExbD [Prevotellaceae bacterium]|jgi:biopolymer transport protein ExbD|nr:biopolymer transporter ExbD [Prevotellaceae bacterium]
MPKVKVKRKSTLIDMTAMSDVTVLLLTFFMLTSTFIQKEPVQVSTPASVSEIKIPDVNVLQILVEPNGKIFLSMDKQDDRTAILQKVGGLYGIEFTPEELKKFKLINSFGISIKNMKQFLALETAKQDEFVNENLKAKSNRVGIPVDTTANLSNELRSWVREARYYKDKDLAIAIKADRTTPYPDIKLVMSTLQGINENRYNLITSLKTIKE